MHEESAGETFIPFTLSPSKVSGYRSMDEFREGSHKVIPCVPPNTIIPLLNMHDARNEYLPGKSESDIPYIMLSPCFRSYWFSPYCVPIHASPLLSISIDSMAEQDSDSIFTASWVSNEYRYSP